MTVMTIHDLLSGKKAHPDNVIPLHPYGTYNVPATTPQIQPELTALLRSVRELTERVNWLERERSEALACASELADQRDAFGTRVGRLEEVVLETNQQMEWLEATIEGLVDGVLEIATSPMAALVRRKLKSAVNL